MEVRTLRKDGERTREAGLLRYWGGNTRYCHGPLQAWLAKQGGDSVYDPHLFKQTHRHRKERNSDPRGKDKPEGTVPGKDDSWPHRNDRSLSTLGRLLISDTCPGQRPITKETGIDSILSGTP